MFQQNFKSHTNQNNAPCQFRLWLIAGSKNIAYTNADTRQQKSNNTDKTHWSNQIHIQKRQGKRVVELFVWSSLPENATPEEIKEIRNEDDARLLKFFENQ